MPDIEQIRAALDGNSAQAQLLVQEEHITERKSNEELHAEIKELRRSIDACIKQAENKQWDIRSRPGSDELDIAILKLKEAKMWCGQVLGELGHKLPAEFRDEAH